MGNEKPLLVKGRQQGFRIPSLGWVLCVGKGNYTVFVIYVKGVFLFTA